MTPLEWSDKDFKVAIIKMLEHAITSSLETNLEIEKLSSKEIGDGKKIQMDVLELEKTELKKKYTR